MKQRRRSMTLTNRRPTSGDDDYPCADRADFASPQWRWPDETQPPFDADGVEGGEEDDTAATGI